MKSLILLVVALVAALSFLSLQDSELTESMERGNEVYADFCITCHLAQGEGVPNAFPPLANSDYLLENREASIRGIKYGQQGELTVNGTTYNGAMPAMGLSDEEIADVMNYILNSWGNTSQKIVTEEEVAAVEQ